MLDVNISRVIFKIALHVVIALLIILLTFLYGLLVKKYKHTLLITGLVFLMGSSIMGGFILHWELIPTSLDWSFWVIALGFMFAGVALIFTSNYDIKTILALGLIVYLGALIPIIYNKKPITENLLKWNGISYGIYLIFVLVCYYLYKKNRSSRPM